MTSRKGEVVEFGGGTSTTEGPWWYVRGHVTYEEAHAAILEWLLEYEDEDYEPPVFGRWRHCWARWGLAGMQSAEEGYQEFMMYPSKARGRFPVTELLEANYLDQRARDRENAARVETVALERWPGIEIISAWGYDKPGVRFKFPGGRNLPATWTLRAEFVYIPLLVNEEWKAFDGACVAARKS